MVPHRQLRYVTMSPSADAAQRNQDIIVFQRFRKASWRALYALVTEILGNYRLVCGLLSAVWIWLTSYVFSFQCLLQTAIHDLKREERKCESQYVFNPSYSTKISRFLHNVFWKTETITKPTKCICGYDRISRESFLTSYDAKLLRAWLSEMGIASSLEEICSPWNDGTLICRLLSRLGDQPNYQLENLNSADRVQNWALAISLMKRRYPGVIQNKLLLHCIASSTIIPSGHVTEVLLRLAYMRKRYWTKRLLKVILVIAEWMDGFLRPGFEMSGPGLGYARVDMRNEFTVRTRFTCPAFTIEIEDELGELWRKNTTLARLNVLQDLDHESLQVPVEETIEIVRVSVCCYRVIYIPKQQLTYKISVKPGINARGHSKGSPFQVVAKSFSSWKKIALIRHPFRNMSSLSSSDHQSFNADSSSSTETPSEGASCNGHSPGVLEEGQCPSGHKGENEAENKNLKGITKSLFRQVSKSINSTVSQYVSTVVTNHTTKILASRRQSFHDSESLSNSTDTDFSSLPGPINGNHLSVAPSRKLTIHRVTIHRYLNKPMPSIEKYFFSEEGIDIHGQLSEKNACKRWNNISSLLRIKMRLAKQVKDEEGKEKARLRLLEQFSTKRKVKTQKSAPSSFHNRMVNSHNQIPRRSSDIFSEKRRDVVSSSSSDDFSEVEPLTSGGIMETPKEGEFLPIFPEPEKTKVQTKNEKITDRKIAPENADDIPRDAGTSRFDHVFSNESGAADILLQKTVLPDSPPILSPAPNYLTLNETKPQPISKRTNFTRRLIKKRTPIEHGKPVAPPDMTDTVRDTTLKGKFNLYINKLVKNILLDGFTEYANRTKPLFKVKTKETKHKQKPVPETSPVVAEIHSVRPKTLINVKFAGDACSDCNPPNLIS